MKPNTISISFASTNFYIIYDDYKLYKHKNGGSEF